VTENRLQLDAFLPYRLSITSNLVSGTIATAYESLFGLRIPEWRTIAVIAEAGSLTQGDVCGRTRMDKVTVSRASIALVDRGLVARSPNPGDARSHLLALTPGGQQLYREIAPRALEFEARIFGSFTAAELDALRDMLARIDAAALSFGG
jgi:DNA-binding MarR family transcriptional regulator